MHYRCNLCVHFTCETLRSLINHLGRVHSSDNGFHVLCGIDGCSRTYTNFYSLRNHFHEKHSLVLRTEEGYQARADGVNANNEVNNINQQNNGDDLGDDGGEDFNFEHEVQANQRANALGLLKVKEEKKVPQTVIDSMVKTITMIVDNSVNLLQAATEQLLSDAGLRVENIPGLNELFDESCTIRKPFVECQNDASQLAYYKNNFGLVEPQKIVLGEYHKKVRKGNKLVDVQKQDTAYYVPLLESIQQLLNNESVLEEIDHPHNSTDGLLRDYCDGEDFHVHPLFSKDKYALQLLLFFDDLEVCNPLGSRANIHKIGNFYYTLGNISPEKRSSLNAIQLVAIANSKHVKQYGIDRILQVIMNDIKQLEQDEGFPFVINGEIRYFRGTIAYSSGDNLGSQLLGGFKEGSQANRKCRECMGLHDAIQRMFHECEFTLRTKDGYELQCRHLTQADHFGVTYGLNRRSVLNDSRYYSVIGGLPGDAMHDVLEGVLQYHTKELLKYYILTEKLFTLNELNKRISTYDYGYHNDSNKPATILRAKLLSADNNLKQHANEMWCLALYLPLLIAEYIPEDDDHWKAYITLLEITRIVFAPVVSKQQMPYLQILIQQHHKYFKELYPECSIIPKMHYMIHMPRTILRLGPLARSWCMRYEAKHSYFKHLAVSSGNFINLPYSLAKRHQEGLCYRIHTPEGSHSTFLSKGNESGPGTQTYAGNVDYRDKLQRSCNFTEVHLQTRIFEAKWVIIGGTKYKINAILHIGYDEDDFPIFWKIHKICIVENNISAIQFVVWPMDTISFERHWQCYEVGFPVKEQMEIRQHQDFSCYIPKHICKPYGKQGGSRFICTRYDHGTSN